MGMSAAAGLHEGHTSAPYAVQKKPSIPMLQPGTTKELFRVASEPERHHSAVSVLHSKKKAADDEKATLIGVRTENTQNMSNIVVHMEEQSQAMKEQAELNRKLSKHLEQSEKWNQQQLEASEGQKKLLANLKKQVRKQNHQVAGQLVSSGNFSLGEFCSNGIRGTLSHQRCFEAWAEECRVQRPKKSILIVHRPSSVRALNGDDRTKTWDDRSI